MWSTSLSFRDLGFSFTTSVELYFSKRTRTVALDQLRRLLLKNQLRSLRGFERFYEKVVTVKADAAALRTFLVLCGFRHISPEKFALGSLRSDDWQLGRPTTSPVMSVFPRIQPASC
jgi:hypothetical protein